MADEVVGFTAQLKDQISGPAKGISDSLGSMQKSLRSLNFQETFKSGVKIISGVASGVLSMVDYFIQATTEEENFRTKLELLTGSKKVADDIAESMDALRPIFKGTEEEMKRLTVSVLEAGLQSEDLANVLPQAFDFKALHGQEAAEQLVSVFGKLSTAGGRTGKDLETLQMKALKPLLQYGIDPLIIKGKTAEATMANLNAELLKKSSGVGGQASAQAAMSLGNVLGIFKEIPQNLIQNLSGTKAFGALGKFASNILGTIGPGSPLFKELSEAFGSTFQQLVEMLVGPLGDGTDSAKAAVGKLIEFVKAVPGYAATAIAMAKDVVATIKAISGTLAPVFKGIGIGVGFILKFLDILSEGLSYTIEYTVMLAKGVIWFLDIMSSGLSYTIEYVVKFVAFFINEFVKVYNTFTGWGEAIGNFFGGITVKLLNFGQDIVDAATNIGTLIWQGIVSGLKAGVTGVGTAISEMGSTVINSFKSILGIKSPSKVFAEMGLQSGEGFAQGITASEKIINSAASGAFMPQVPAGQGGRGGGMSIGAITLQINVDGGNAGSPEALGDRIMELLPGALMTAFEGLALEQGSV